VIRKKKVFVHSYVSYGFDLASDYFGIAKNACLVLALHRLIHDNRVEQVLLMKEDKRAHVNRVREYAAKHMVDVDRFIEEHPKKGTDAKMVCIELYGKDLFIKKLERLAEERDMKFSPFIRKMLLYSIVEDRFFDQL
jgi:hypothetical protein